MNKNKKRNILFVHQNFPGQYKNIAPALIKNKNLDISSLSFLENYTFEGMTNHFYKINRGNAENVNPLAVEFETKILRAEACANKAIELRESGYIPDLIIGHTGWGELLFLKEVWPSTKFLSYVEFHYNLVNSDIDFDAENSLDPTPYTKRKLIARNSPYISQYLMSDYLITPTEFQKSTFEEIFQDKINVIHEGIDTNILKPEKLSLNLGDEKFTNDDKIVLFASRNLEPYRGYHIFIRSIPEILKKHPDAIFLVIGGTKKGYGKMAPEGKTFKEIFFNEISDKIDTSRVKFLDVVSYADFISCLQIASAHIYLTYPFVLSWSMLESMSCGGLIIGSNTDPVKEIIEHKKNGLLVDFFDYSKISEFTIDILNNPPKYKSMRENARKTILDKYDLETQCLPKHIELINKILYE